MPVSDPFDPSIVILAALVLFVIWKLRSVLDVRVDREKPPAVGRFRPLAPPSPEGAQPGGAQPSAFAASASEPAQDRWKGLAEPGGKAWTGLDAVAAADPRFSGKAFIDGARKAYEMIVEAFAQGDRDMLRRLLAKDVFEGFEREIDAREERGETAETELVSIDSATIDDAKRVQGAVQITVRFRAKLITVRRGPTGEVIEGDPSEPVEIVDLWTFARELASRDPNWKLVATESAQ